MSSRGDAPVESTGRVPPWFHVLAKPTGSTCNIDCTYCFFLSKSALYPDQKQRMSPATLEEYLRQLLEAHRSPEVTVAWQGGEPTLMRLDFFKQSVALVEKHRRPDQVVHHTFQTNGLLLDDAWCAFFKEHDFLVGLSVDGPRELHDCYRRDRKGQGTFDRVMNGWQHLRKHGVEVNVLCTVNAANQHHGREVYRFFRDDLGTRWMQFIPVIERATAETLPIANQGWATHAGRERLLYTQTGALVTERSVGGEQYGRFLIDIFEEWVRRDVGTVFVQMFEVALSAYFGRYTLCVHAPTCGSGPALEYNGDLYTCDHFVEPAHKLGNIHQRHLGDLVGSEQMRRFGQAKLNTLTRQCRECEVRFLCNGGCPKDRFTSSRDGEAGQNYLCPGLELFFKHTRPAMVEIAKRVGRGLPAAGVMEWVAQEDARRGGYAPCPCSSGRKLKFCHGARAVALNLSASVSVPPEASAPPT